MARYWHSGPVSGNNSILKKKSVCFLMEGQNGLSSCSKGATFFIKTILEFLTFSYFCPRAFRILRSSALIRLFQNLEPGPTQHLKGGGALTYDDTREMPTF